MIREEEWSEEEDGEAAGQIEAKPRGIFTVPGSGSLGGCATGQLRRFSGFSYSCFPVYFLFLLF